MLSPPGPIGTTQCVQHRATDSRCAAISRALVLMNISDAHFLLLFLFFFFEGFHQLFNANSPLD